MILIVDDDAIVRSSLRMLLRTAGFETTDFAEPDSAKAWLRGHKPRLVLLDMNFSRFTTGDEGLTMLRQIKVLYPDVPVILITAWGSIELAVEGMRAGAFDFITKPWDNRRLVDCVKTALKVAEPPVAPRTDGFDRSMIIGDSPELDAVLDTVARIAPTNAPVLITGESGTGKELIAEALHRNSPRRNKPFVKVNLGGLSQTLFESEMFGYRRGAFTGAVADRIGRFEAADGGTIFLDEIGELDLICQVKLLRVLQDQTFEPLGTSTTRRVDVRVVCATNADLPAMVRRHEFREDLLYRINLVNVELPPLRRRPGDIPALARHFIGQAAKANRRPVPAISPDAMALLQSRPYPGNIRELKNTVERALLMSQGLVLTPDDFDADTSVIDDSQIEGTIGNMERERIRRAIAAHNGNLTHAAAELGLSRGALYRRIEKYGLK